jgi:DNA-binding GntR family transcriptional regulator
MPVREAIRRLEEAGLAERVPNKGAVVKGLTLSELAHVYEVRRVLEAEAARNGARAITPAEVDVMHRYYEQIQTAVADGDLVGALHADEAMLETLYRSGGNPVLTELICGLWQRCRAYKIAGAYRAAEESNNDSAWTLYQPQIIQAARDNNARAAARLTEQSLRDASRRIQAQLAEQHTTDIQR